MADRVVQIADGRIASIEKRGRRAPARELAW
jgi:hypothetical protein